MDSCLNTHRDYGTNGKRGNGATVCYAMCIKWNLGVRERRAKWREGPATTAVELCRGKTRARIVGRDVAALTEEIKDRQRREEREAKKRYRTRRKTREDGERERNEKERAAAEATKRGDERGRGRKGERENGRERERDKSGGEKRSCERVA